MKRIPPILLLYPLLFLGSSCKKEVAKFKTDKYGNMYIWTSQAQITTSEIIPWKVGPLRRQRVSKGVRITVKFPQLKPEDMGMLVERRKIDSWLFRVRKRSSAGSQVLGQMYYPIAVPGQDGGRSSFRIRQVKNGFVNIFFAAAAVGKRFENMACPAFNHSKIIGEAEVIRRKNRRPLKISVSKGDAARVRGRIEKFSYAPQVLNGGMNLNGRYTVELALYQSTTKSRKSSFVELQEEVEVSKEKNKVIKGCAGNTTPLPPREQDGIDKFKFGS